MQVDPIKPKLKLPGTKRLKLKYDVPLSNFAFKFNLRRFTLVEKVSPALFAIAHSPNLGGALQAGGLHSSTSHLNLSRF